MSIKRHLSSFVFSKPYRLLDLINWNARFMQWHNASGDAPIFKTREELYRHVHENVGNVAVDYLEFGVYRGESLGNWALMNAHPRSRFFGFDTFTGLPEDWIAMKAGTFDTGGQAPEIADARVRFIKGLFQETLEDFLASFSPNGRLIVHVDSDLYTSGLYVLTMMNRFMVPGSIVIFDEFGSFIDEFRAWSDYCSAYYRRAALIGRVDVTQVAFEML